MCLAVVMRDVSKSLGVVGSLYACGRATGYRFEFATDFLKMSAVLLQQCGARGWAFQLL